MTGGRERDMKETRDPPLLRLAGRSSLLYILSASRRAKFTSVSKIHLCLKERLSLTGPSSSSLSLSLAFHTPFERLNQWCVKPWVAGFTHTQNPFLSTVFHPVRSRHFRRFPWSVVVAIGGRATQEGRVKAGISTFLARKKRHIWTEQARRHALILSKHILTLLPLFSLLENHRAQRVQRKIWPMPNVGTGLCVFTIGLFVIKALMAAVVFSWE